MTSKSDGAIERDEGSSAAVYLIRPIDRGSMLHSAAQTSCAVVRSVGQSDIRNGRWHACGDHSEWSQPGQSVAQVGLYRQR